MKGITMNCSHCNGTGKSRKVKDTFDLPPVCRWCSGTGNDPRLFIGIFPAGISYADRSKEEDGDYKKIAFLPYRSLELEIRDPRSDLLTEIKKHAATVQARRGELFEVSACGQTVKLGS